MRIFIIIGICFISLIFSVNSFSNSQKATILLNPYDQFSQQVTCWFEDKRYSEGAIIMMANTRVICAPKTPNHSNSALSWLMLNDKNEIIYPQTAKTIRVN